MYSEEEVRAKTLEYFGGDELATNVFMTKYCLKDKQGNLTELTPDDMHVRMAKEFARMEEKIDRQEAEAEAAAELSGATVGDELDAKFRELEADHGADDALDVLKAKMGVAQVADTTAEAESSEEAFDLAELEELEALIGVPAEGDGRR